MATARLLTGNPRTGKTTIIKQSLAQTGYDAGGFFTEEIRSGNTRKGFKIISLHGQEAILAHADYAGKYRVGRYGIDIEALENTGVKSVEEALANNQLIVIDEIGKMELFSDAFRDSVKKAISSTRPILGTIMLKSEPYVDYIKLMKSVEVIEVNINNRSNVLEDTIRWIRQLK
jgi:nucleoside-triphosphatase